jgi:hypothetical protein
VNITDNRLLYDLPIIYRQDFIDLRNQVIPLYINKPNPLPEQVHKLMFYGFPIIPEGRYQLKFDYYLPGKPHPNSSVTRDLNLNFSN